MLEPTEEDQTKPADLAELDALIAESTNPRFIADCRSLREQFQPGDQLIEFCTSIASWQANMGGQGYRLLRNGEAIAGIWTRLN
jgi:hypothetical protein